MPVKISIRRLQPRSYLDAQVNFGHQLSVSQTLSANERSQRKTEIREISTQNEKVTLTEKDEDQSDRGLEFQSTFRTNFHSLLKKPSHLKSEKLGTLKQLK